MTSRRNQLHILYTWLVVGAGFYALSHLFVGLNLDLGREFLTLSALGILAWWLAVYFPHGQLSGSYAIVLASYVIHGPSAAAWIGFVAVLAGQGIANRGNPMRTTFFNGSQYVLALWGADYAFTRVGGFAGMPLDAGSAIPILVFTSCYFLINHLLVYMYLVPRERRYNLAVWRDALRWDGLTYLFTAPFGVVMAMVYSHTGLGGMLLLFIPVLVVQFVLRRYVHLELANRELTALYNVIRRLNNKMNPDEIIDLMLTEVHRAVNYHTGLVYLWSEESRNYVAMGVHGPYARQLQGSQMSPGEGFIGAVLDGREPVLIEDVRKQPELKEEPGLMQVHRSLLMVPLLAEEEVLGIVVLGDKRPATFNEVHLHILSIICGQAAVLLANNLLCLRLETGAVTDRLTGVYNRSYLFRRVEEEFERVLEQEGSLAVINLELDGLKYINDRFGYHFGDGVLVETAQLLQRLVEPGGVVFRSGGKEFSVLLPGVDREEAAQAAEGLRRSVREHYFRIDDMPRLVRVSVGVAVYPGDASSPVVLLQKADRALQRAKKNGRDQVVLAAQLVGR